MITIREAKLASQYPDMLGVDHRREKVLIIALEDVLHRGLPEGWTLQADEADRGYFWNEYTGESLWEHPDHDIFDAIVKMHRKSLLEENRVEYLRDSWHMLEIQLRREEGSWSGPHLTEDNEKFWYNEGDDKSVWHNPKLEIDRRHFVRSGLVLALLADAEHRPVEEIRKDLLANRPPQDTNGSQGRTPKAQLVLDDSALLGPESCMLTPMPGDNAGGGMSHRSSTCSVRPPASPSGEHVPLIATPPAGALPNDSPGFRFRRPEYFSPTAESIKRALSPLPPSSGRSSTVTTPMPSGRSTSESDDPDRNANANDEDMRRTQAARAIQKAWFEFQLACAGAMDKPAKGSIPSGACGVGDPGDEQEAIVRGAMRKLEKRFIRGESFSSNNSSCSSSFADEEHYNVEAHMPLSHEDGADRLAGASTFDWKSAHPAEVAPQYRVLCGETLPDELPPCRGQSAQECQADPQLSGSASMDTTENSLGVNVGKPVRPEGVEGADEEPCEMRGQGTPASRSRRRDVHVVDGKLSTEGPLLHSSISRRRSPDVDVASCASSLRGEQAAFDTVAAAALSAQATVRPFNSDGADTSVAASVDSRLASKEAPSGTEPQHTAIGDGCVVPSVAAVAEEGGLAPSAPLPSVSVEPHFGAAACEVTSAQAVLMEPCAASVAGESSTTPEVSVAAPADSPIGIVRPAPAAGHSTADASVDRSGAVGTITDSDDQVPKAAKVSIASPIASMPREADTNADVADEGQTSLQAQVCLPDGALPLALATNPPQVADESSTIPEVSVAAPADGPIGVVRPAPAAGYSTTNASVDRSGAVGTIADSDDQAPKAAQVSVASPIASMPRTADINADVADEVQTGLQAQVSVPDGALPLARATNPPQVAVRSVGESSSLAEDTSVGQIPDDVASKGSDITAPAGAGFQESPSPSMTTRPSQMPVPEISNLHELAPAEESGNCWTETPVAKAEQNLMAASDAEREIKPEEAPIAELVLASGQATYAEHEYCQRETLSASMAAEPTESQIADISAASRDEPIPGVESLSLDAPNVEVAEGSGETPATDAIVVSALPVASTSQLVAVEACAENVGGSRANVAAEHSVAVGEVAPACASQTPAAIPELIAPTTHANFPVVEEEAVSCTEALHGTTKLSDHEVHSRSPRCIAVTSFAACAPGHSADTSMHTPITSPKTVTPKLPFSSHPSPADIASSSFHAPMASPRLPAELVKSISESVSSVKTSIDHPQRVAPLPPAHQHVGPADDVVRTFEVDNGGEISVEPGVPVVPSAEVPSDSPKPLTPTPSSCQHPVQTHVAACSIDSPPVDPEPLVDSSPTSSEIKTSSIGISSDSPTSAENKPLSPSHVEAQSTDVFVGIQRHTAGVPPPPPEAASSIHTPLRSPTSAVHKPLSPSHVAAQSTDVFVGIQKHSAGVPPPPPEAASSIHTPLGSPTSAENKPLSPSHVAAQSTDVFVGIQKHTAGVPPPPPEAASSIHTPLGSPTSAVHKPLSPSHVAALSTDVFVGIQKHSAGVAPPAPEAAASIHTPLGSPKRVAPSPPPGQPPASAKGISVETFVHRNCPAADSHIEAPAASQQCVAPPLPAGEPPAATRSRLDRVGADVEDDGSADWAEGPSAAGSDADSLTSGSPAAEAPKNVFFGKVAVEEMDEFASEDSDDAFKKPRVGYARPPGDPLFGEPRPLSRQMHAPLILRGTVGMSAKRRRPPPALTEPQQSTESDFNAARPEICGSSVHGVHEGQALPFPSPSSSSTSPAFSPAWYRDELKLKGKDLKTFGSMMEHEQVDEWEEFVILVHCEGYDIRATPGWRNLTHLGKHRLSTRVASLLASRQFDDEDGAVHKERTRNSTPKADESGGFDVQTPQSPSTDVNGKGPQAAGHVPLSPNGETLLHARLRQGQIGSRVDLDQLAPAITPLRKARAERRLPDREGMMKTSAADGSSEARMAEEGDHSEADLGAMGKQAVRLRRRARGESQRAHGSTRRRPAGNGEPDSRANKSVEIVQDAARVRRRARGVDRQRRPDVKRSAEFGAGESGDSERDSIVDGLDAASVRRRARGIDHHRQADSKRSPKIGVGEGQDSEADNTAHGFDAARMRRRARGIDHQRIRPLRQSAADDAADGDYNEADCGGLGQGAALMGRSISQDVPHVRLSDGRADAGTCRCDYSSEHCGVHDAEIMRPLRTASCDVKRHGEAGADEDNQTSGDEDGDEHQLERVRRPPHGDFERASKPHICREPGHGGYGRQKAEMTTTGRDVVRTRRRARGRINASQSPSSISYVGDAQGERENSDVGCSNARDDMARMRRRARVIDSQIERSSKQCVLDSTRDADDHEARPAVGGEGMVPKTRTKNDRKQAPKSEHFAEEVGEGANHQKNVASALHDTLRMTTRPRGQNWTPNDAPCTERSGDQNSGEVRTAADGQCTVPIVRGARVDPQLVSGAQRQAEAGTGDERPAALLRRKDTVNQGDANLESASGALKNVVSSPKGRHMQSPGHKFDLSQTEGARMKKRSPHHRASDKGAIDRAHDMQDELATLWDDWRKDVELPKERGERILEGMEEQPESVKARQRRWKQAIDDAAKLDQQEKHTQQDLAFQLAWDAPKEEKAQKKITAADLLMCDLKRPPNGAPESFPGGIFHRTVAGFSSRNDNDMFLQSMTGFRDPHSLGDTPNHRNSGSVFRMTTKSSGWRPSGDAVVESGAVAKMTATPSAPGLYLPGLLPQNRWTPLAKAGHHVGLAQSASVPTISNPASGPIKR